PSAKPRSSGRPVRMGGDHGPFGAAPVLLAVGGPAMCFALPPTGTPPPAGLGGDAVGPPTGDPLVVPPTVPSTPLAANLSGSVTYTPGEGLTVSMLNDTTRLKLFNLLGTDTFSRYLRPLGAGSLPPTRAV